MRNDTIFIYNLNKSRIKPKNEYNTLEISKNVGNKGKSWEDRNTRKTDINKGLVSK